MTNREGNIGINVQIHESRDANITEGMYNVHVQFTTFMIKSTMFLAMIWVYETTMKEV